MARRKVSSGADVKAFLKGIEGSVLSEIKASEEAIAKKVAEDIFEKSQEYVPADTGDLENSGRVVKNGDGVYRVEYTDWKAFMLHENIAQDLPLDARNGAAKYGAQGNAKNYTKPGSGPKYLERAATEVAENRDVVRYFRDELGRFKKRIVKD